MTENSDIFTGLKISSNKSLNDLVREQERSLKELREHIKTPFRDKWEYVEWRTEAVALQLSQTKRNDFFLNAKALWEYLLMDAKRPDGTPVNEQMRDWIIFMIHGHLEKTYSRARRELAERENDITSEI